MAGGVWGREADAPQYLQKSILPDMDVSERAIKFSIQVNKGQSFQLNTSRVHAVTMGLGWDMVGRAIGACRVRLVRALPVSPQCERTWTCVRVRVPG